MTPDVASAVQAAEDPERGAGAVGVLLMFLRELLEMDAVEPEAVDAARERLLRSGGELWMDGWREAVEATASALTAACASPGRRRAYFQRQVEAVEAGTAAAGVLPVLVRMYPEMAEELPESLAGLARAGLIGGHGATRLLTRLEVEEGEVRFQHALGETRRGAPGVADA